jgi:ABC-type nitrate/sulfonate/bicarbonate transport system substrate-binding protein
MALEIGQSAGIWKKVGIDVQIAALRGDSQIQQALTAGSLDVGIGSGPALAFLVKGVPALAVAALSGAPDHMALIVGPNSPIKGIADMKGRRIGVTSHGAVTEWLAEQVAVLEGWPTSSITIVPLGDAKGELAGLKTGAVDGFVSSVDIGYDLEEHHQGQIVVNFGHEVVKRFHNNLIFARTDFINAHPDLLKKFLDGWFQTIAYMQNHREETIKIAAQNEGFSEETMAKTYAVLMPMLSRNGAFDQQSLNLLAKSFTDLGMVDHPVDPNQYITTKFVPVHI